MIVTSLVGRIDVKAKRASMVSWTQFVGPGQPFSGELDWYLIVESTVGSVIVAILRGNNFLRSLNCDCIARAVRCRDSHCDAIHRYAFANCAGAL